MKFLMLLAILLFGIWLWRSNREASVKSKDTAGKPAPMAMVGCSLCAVHVLEIDALRGKKGFYCCQEHRQRAEP